MQRVLLVWSLVLSACSSNSPAPGPDASGTGLFGAACTTVSDTSNECMGKACTNTIDMAGHNVCSQTCTMLNAQDPSCPTGSMGQKCNMKGYCKP
jgi:hypothetical protein